MEISEQQWHDALDRISDLEKQLQQPSYFRDDPDLHTIIALGPDGAKEWSAQRRSRERRNRR